MDSMKLQTVKNQDKRGNLKVRIEQYYKILSQGCGNINCPNENCASSFNFVFSQMDSNMAAVKAIKLCKDKAKLCCDFEVDRIMVKNDFVAIVRQPTSESQPICILLDLPLLIKKCEANGSYTFLNSAIYTLFSQRDELYNFFSYPKSALKFTDNTALIKNQIKGDSSVNREIAMETNESNWLIDRHSRASSVDISNVEVYDAEAGSSVDAQEVIEPTSSNQTQPDEININVDKIRNFYKMLLLIDGHPFLNALSNALLNLSRDLQFDMRGTIEWAKINIASLIIIIMEFPLLDSVELLEKAVPTFYKIFRYIPVSVNSTLVQYWSKFKVEDLKNLVRAVQQCITLQIVLGDWTAENLINKDLSITGAVALLKLLFYASLLGGSFNLPLSDSLAKPASSFKLENFKQLNGASKMDELQDRLNFNPILSRMPVLQPSEFVNESLSNAIEIDHDFSLYKSEDSTLNVQDAYFSFLKYSFVLTTLVKSKALFYDNRITMLQERRNDFMMCLVAPYNYNMPYLKLHIRRDHIIDDALVNLEFVATESPQDLRKQLFIEFEGEQAVDEGGVSKEFFQILVEQLFNPDFGMFIYNEETHCFWFNENSLENESQFVLIGILLGLAIYNSVILDIRLPPVVYRKLLDKMATFDDLKLTSPTMYHSLIQLLTHEGEVEKDMGLNFSIDAADMFGNLHTHDLKPDGRNIPVTNLNRREYVDLYSDYILNKSIEQQFLAFKKGFDMVTNKSPLTEFFSPDEVELLVCGSENLNFIELEESTEYDGGFASDSLTIKNFWKVAHEMTNNDKRRLLQFVTGSDRVPIGGLAKLKLVITKNGPDSNRLPTAHTCFNVLMLPDYSSESKLKERLLKAIDYAKGFGML